MRVGTCMLRPVTFPKWRRVRVAAVLAAFAGLSIQACETRSPFGPYRGSIRFSPPASYFTWWQQMEDCSGLTGDFSSITWYVLPGASRLQVNGVEWYGAYYPNTNAIVLPEAFLNDSSDIRHEQLHALLRWTMGHPPEYFADKCGALVKDPPFELL